MPKTLLLNLFGLIAAIVYNSPLSAQSSSPPQPNILLIFMDDMGYGDLECYGNPLIKTPNLNKLAEGGIRFTSFYAAAAVCTPSRAGLLTGRYPVRNAPHNFGPESTNGLPLSEITLAQVLKEAGYRTGIIGKWHLGHNPQYLPTNRGFDSFFGLPYSNDMILPWCPWLSDKDTLFLYEDDKKLREIGKKQEMLTLDYTEKAIEFIKEDRDKPFFLYLAHSMPHLPINAAPKFRGTSEAGLYGDVIEMVDWTIGELHRTLEEEGLAENTLIIFTSDNGPWQNLPDRMLQDGVERWHAGTTGGLRGAKATSYEGGFRVPGIVYWPGVIEENQVNREIASTLDIFPTLIEIGGANMPDQVQIDGKNMLSTWKGESSSPRKTFFYCRNKSVQGIREKEWKYRVTESDGEQLFHMNQDPYEMYNLADSYPEKVKALRQKLEEFAQETQVEMYRAKGN